MKRFLFAAGLFLLPSMVFAAGFARDPLFLSRTPVTEGTKVRVYAVIQNIDASSFTGLLVFYDAGTRIGSTTVSLDSGATQTASIGWTPLAGTHPITADLITPDGNIAQEVSNSFTVVAPPQPAAPAGSTANGAFNNTQSAAAIDSSAAIQKDIAGVSPQVANASQPVFTFVDSARNTAANTLDSQIASTKKNIAANPKTAIVGGDFTKDAQIQNPSTGVWYWVYTIYLWILEALRWLVGSAGIFYPLLAFLFLYILWRLYRRFRRPSYGY